MFSKLFKDYPCPECSKKNVTVNFEDKKGFCYLVSVKCHERVIVQEYTSGRVHDDNSTRPPFPVNRRMCEAFISFGLGHAAMESFCENMGMHSMAVRSFHQHLNALSHDFKKLREEMFREAYVDEDPSLQDSPVIDATVSLDVSWQKRGFTSNYGVGFVVDKKTGLILDMACASKYCHSCVLQEKSLGAATPEFKQWYDQHLE